MDRLTSSDPTDLSEIASADSMSVGNLSRTLQLAFLAPDIVGAVAAGRQPVDFTTQKPKQLGELPYDLPAQRRFLGFNAINWVTSGHASSLVVWMSERDRRDYCQKALVSLLDTRLRENTGPKDPEVSDRAASQDNFDRCIRATDGSATHATMPATIRPSENETSVSRTRVPRIVPIAGIRVK